MLTSQYNLLCKGICQSCHMLLCYRRKHLYGHMSLSNLVCHNIVSIYIFVSLSMKCHSTHIQMAAIINIHIQTELVVELELSSKGSNVRFRHNSIICQEDTKGVA